MNWRFYKKKKKTVSQTAKSWSAKKRLFQCVMEGYWAQAIFRCFYKALEMTGSINEAAVKTVTFLKIRRRTDVFFFCRGRNKRNCCEVLSKQSWLKAILDASPMHLAPVYAI